MNFSMKPACLLIAAGVFWTVPAFAELSSLPDRERPGPVTTDGIPHIQIGVEAVPEISAGLLARVAAITGIELQSTLVGRSGSTGFWLNEGITLARPDSIIRGREFAHLHPDGSLHASLPPELALNAIKAGWAIHHPWASKKRGLEGFVMIYTPASPDELDVVMQLIRESYKFVTGKDTVSTD